MPICTYLIKSLENKYFYTGISSDPYRRLAEHNLGKLKSTKLHRPYKLIYYKEHVNYSEARKHEKWLKKKNIEYKTMLEERFENHGLPRL